MLPLYKREGLGQALCTDLVLCNDGDKQMMGEIRKIREEQ